MAATGLLLTGFLLSHVGGNSLLLVSDDGEAYNAYAERLRSFGPLLWVARVGLALLFVGHIGLAFRTSVENRRARGSRRARGAFDETRSFSSSSMLLTGTAVLVFLVVHLWHFSFDRRFTARGASLVRDTLKADGVAIFYLVGVACLWIHLWHALPSALQTLGVTHPRWTPLVRIACRTATCVVCALFIAILVASWLPGTSG